MTENRPYTLHRLHGLLEITVKERTHENFGKRLAELRRQRGLTQAQLGAMVGASNRVIAYYEQKEAQPPGAMLAELAVALGVSADELLGLDEASQPAVEPKKARLLKRLEKVAELPPNDQRAVVKFVEALAAARRTKPKTRKRAAAGG